MAGVEPIDIDFIKLKIPSIGDTLKSILLQKKKNPSIEIELVYGTDEEKKVNTQTIWLKYKNINILKARLPVTFATFFAEQNEDGTIRSQGIFNEFMGYYIPAVSEAILEEINSDYYALCEKLFVRVDFMLDEVQREYAFTIELLQQNENIAFVE